MLGRYPSAESYIKKQLGANFPRWGAPWLQGFTAASFASSRSEGANKDYKHGVLLRTLTLMTKTWRARSLFILWRRSRKLILGRWTSGASLSTWIVFYDPVRVQCNREGDNVTVFKSHWCTCGMCITAGLPCRHFYAAHRDLAWAGFHVHLNNTRWHKTQLESSLLWTYGTNATRVSATVAAPLSAKVSPVLCAGLHQVLDIPVDQQRHARQLYGKLWGKSRTVTSLICVDYGYVEQDAAEELLACLVRIEDGIRKRKALEAAAPADRALMAKIQAVANVQDYNRPDNKAKGRRKCSKCGSAGHNRATCPKREPAQENLPPLGPTTGDGAPATSAAAGAAP
mmetsp:Transcript_34545/g.87138  ORF Transcript_34545/g.87138 Transcript_34545/m.87138 type:complete len:341 (-) Transcript_34545:72-1094(-)